MNYKRCLFDLVSYVFYIGVFIIYYLSNYCITIWYYILTMLILFYILVTYCLLYRIAVIVYIQFLIISIIIQPYQITYILRYDIKDITFK